MGGSANIIELLKHKWGRVVVVILLAFALWIVWPLIFEGSKPTARVHGANFNIEVASTSAQRTKGLSGHTVLRSDQAMLFIHESSGIQCYWMKDMRFPIDILWFDARKKLIHVEQNASPDSYPKNFCPPSDAQYVLEMKAGMADFIHAKTGDELFLSNL